MTRNTWAVEKKVSGSWVSDGTIYVPNDFYNYTLTTTMQTLDLADGEQAFVTPSIKYRKGDLALIWYYVELDLATKIEGYITDQIDLKLTDHNSNIFYGRFTYCEKQELLGQEDIYNVRATFKIIDSLV